MKLVLRFGGRFGLQVLLALLIALATLSSPLFAQVKSSAITGTVTDTSGAVLPGVNVTVTETGTGTVNTTLTNEVGQYNVPYLPIGKYTVEVTYGRIPDLPQNRYRPRRRHHPPQRRRSCRSALRPPRLK